MCGQLADLPRRALSPARRPLGLDGRELFGRLARAEAGGVSGQPAQRQRRQRGVVGGSGGGVTCLVRCFRLSRVRQFGRFDPVLTFQRRSNASVRVCRHLVVRRGSRDAAV